MNSVQLNNAHLGLFPMWEFWNNHFKFCPGEKFLCRVTEKTLIVNTPNTVVLMYFWATEKESPWVRLNKTIAWIPGMGKQYCSVTWLWQTSLRCQQGGCLSIPWYLMMGRETPMYLVWVDHSLQCFGILYVPLTCDTEYTALRVVQLLDGDDLAPSSAGPLGTGHSGVKAGHRRWL
jgi:hypothetical protein